MGAGGDYLVSLVFYVCFFQADPTGLPVVDSGLTPAQAAAFQKVAWDTVSTYPYAGMAPLP